MSSDGASGRVDERPVPWLLMRLRGHQITGRIDIREAAGPASTLYLRAGRPVHVVRPDSLDRLDHILVEAGLVSHTNMAVAEEHRNRSGGLIGQVLRKLGLVEPEKLSQALQIQLRRKVTRLFSPEQATFKVADIDHAFGLDEASPGAAIEPGSLVFPGIFANYGEERLARELGELAGRLVRLGPLTEAELGDLGFESSHGPLFAQLRNVGLRVPEDWVQSIGGPRAREAKAILLALRYLDVLEFPEAVVSKPLEPAVSKSSESIPVMRPTPLPGPAHTGAGFIALDAPAAFVIGQTSFKNGDMGRAEEAFQAAAKADPANKRSQAFLAWIRFWKPNTVREGVIDETMKVFREALKADNDFAYGHYFVGGILKFRNEIDKATAAFRTAQRLDPHMIEAERELRLINMRKARRG